MRHIEKGRPPDTITETLKAATTDLTQPARARTAYEQIDKPAVRFALVREQGWLCAFCMRRIDDRAVDAKGDPTLKIAHRTPIAVDPTQALSWRNLLGSCDGGQRADWRRNSCDAAQGATPLTVDPTSTSSCAKLRFERRGAREGLFITSDDPVLERDVARTLGLDSGDLPAAREAVWKGFLAAQRRDAPRDYGRPAWRAFFEKWKARGAPRLPEMIGVVEAKLREPSVGAGN